MSDPNAFTAHHFALLHLLGLLSISRTIEGEKAREARGTSDPYVNLSEGDVPLPIPELLMLNALCYLTEQIHQVSQPPATLQVFLQQVSQLAYEVKPVRGVDAIRSYTLPSSHTHSVGLANSRSPASRSAAKSPRRGGAGPSTSPSQRRSSRLAANPVKAGKSEQHESVIEVDFARTLAERLRDAVTTDAAKVVAVGFGAVLDSISEFPYLLGEVEDPNSHSFLDRSSPLGVWVRRRLLDIKKLSFAEAHTFVDSFVKYAGLDVDQPGRVTNAVIPVQPQTDHFLAHVSASRRSDYPATCSHLLQFFDHHAPLKTQSKDRQRGVRQHGLLNLASFHLSHGEYSAARLAADEGFRIARQAGDLTAVNALTSVLKRISMESRSGDNTRDLVNLAADDAAMDITDTYNSLRDDPGGHVPPLDHLLDVRSGIAGRVVLPALTGNLLRAKALNYASLTHRRHLSAKERRKERKLAEAQGREVNTTLDAHQRKIKWNRLDAMAYTATAADLWLRMGVSSLARLYTDMGTVMRGDTRDEVHGSDLDKHGTEAVILLCQRANDLAHRGAYDTALCVLLSHAFAWVNEMSVQDVQNWQTALNSVLHVQATRKGYERVLRHINLTYTPSAPATAFSRYTKQPVNSISPSRLAGPDFHSPEDVGFISDIETLLKRAAELLECNQPALALPLVVRACDLSDHCHGQILLDWHRRARITLTRTLCDHDMPDKAWCSLEEVWADILGTGDAELIADAQLVRVKCQDALTGLHDPPTITEGGNDIKAMLSAACETYSRLSCNASNLRGLQALAEILDRQGDVVHRDEVAASWRSVIREVSSGGQKELEMLDRVYSLQQLVAVVSARSATGYR